MCVCARVWKFFIRPAGEYKIKSLSTEKLLANHENSHLLTAPCWFAFLLSFFLSFFFFLKSDWLTDSSNNSLESTRSECHNHYRDSVDKTWASRSRVERGQSNNHFCNSISGEGNRIIETHSYHNRVYLIILVSVICTRFKVLARCITIARNWTFDEDHFWSIQFILQRIFCKNRKIGRFSVFVFTNFFSV